MMSNTIHAILLELNITFAIPMIFDHLEMGNVLRMQYLCFRFVKFIFCKGHAAAWSWDFFVFLYFCVFHTLRWELTTFVQN